MNKKLEEMEESIDDFKERINKTIRDNSAKINNNKTDN